jgi:hypothetical protein
LPEGKNLKSPLRAPTEGGSREGQNTKSPRPLGEGQGEGNSLAEGNPIKNSGIWIPIDATLAQGGIAADHLKLAHSNLKGASAYSSFLPVVQVVGRLKIEIMVVE